MLSKPDFVVANFGDASVSVFLGNGTGLFHSAITSPADNVFETGPFALTTSDFNGDGQTDLAVVAYEVQDVALLPGLCNRSFGPATLFGAGSVPYAIASLALRTGKPNELVVLNQSTGLVSVLRNTGK